MSAQPDDRLIGLRLRHIGPVTIEVAGTLYELRGSLSGEPGYYVATRHDDHRVWKVSPGEEVAGLVPLPTNLSPEGITGIPARLVVQRVAEARLSDPTELAVLATDAMRGLFTSRILREAEFAKELIYLLQTTFFNNDTAHRLIQELEEGGDDRDQLYRDCISAVTMLARRMLDNYFKAVDSQP